MRLTWLGQGGFLIESAGMRIAVDPYLSTCVEDTQGLTRLMPPPLSRSELRPDALVCTHNHIDHFDPIAVPQIMRAFPDCLLVGPESVRKKAEERGIPPERFVLLDGNHVWNRMDVVIHAMPAFHSDPHAIGLLIHADSHLLYISGDTQYRDELALAIARQAAGRTIDCACVCINGKLGNMSAAEAAVLMREMSPALAIPMHYGLFAENTVDPEPFARMCRERCVICTVPCPGNPIPLPPN